MIGNTMLEGKNWNFIENTNFVNSEFGVHFG
jgi:hypothetical protein